MERAWLEMQAEERALLCRHCGRPWSQCSDPERRFYPQRSVCYASMESAAANAKWGRLHEERPWHDGSFKSWAKEPSASHPYFKDWGVTIGVTDVDLRPDDTFLSREDCGPLPVASGQPQDHEDQAGDPEDQNGQS